MGIFDCFKKQDPAPEVPSAPKAEPKPFGPTLIEIARIISGGDEEVLQDVTSCAQDPKGWFAAHQERYEERGVVDDPDDLDQVQWLGLVDILEERGWVCDRDWKDELEDFSYFLQNLKGFQALGLELDESWFDEDEDIPAWCTVLTEKWRSQEVRVAAININTDSYVLFPTTYAHLDELQKLAGKIGQCIDCVEQM